MPKISELARVSPSADILDDLPTNAWVVWATAKERAGATAKPHEMPGGIPGVEWRGSLSRLIDELWDDLPKGDGARTRLNGYLAETMNMRCLVKGRDPIWWVRDEWNSEPVDAGRGFVTVRTRRPGGPTTVEVEPAPVETAWLCPRCSRRSPSKESHVCDTHAGDLLADPSAAIRALLADRDRLAAENVELRSKLARIASTPLSEIVDLLDGAA